MPVDFRQLRMQTANPRGPRGRMQTILIDPRRIAEIYETLDTIGCLGEPRKDGFLRSSWSEEEDAAMALIRGIAEKSGLSARYDSVGNLFLEWPGTSPEFVETGSHVDTVPRGGNFDGAAGVVAGVCAIESILKLEKPKRGLRLRIWRGEEGSTFALACKGSRAAFACFPKPALNEKFQGQTLAEAIRGRGFSTDIIDQGVPSISQSEIDGIAAHIELHIEQANYLEVSKSDIGIVTSIRGPIRFRIFLEGSFDHSGGTPMGVEYRRDANLAFCHIGVALDRLADEARRAGGDLVQTIGVINSDQSVNQGEPRVYQNGTAKVSGFCYFHLDIRSNQTEFRARYVKQALDCVASTARQFGVMCRITELGDTKPLETLSPRIQKALSDSSARLQYPAVLMPSGALHDCLYVSNPAKSDGTHPEIGMIFIPCLNGKSHSPEEYTSVEAIAKGASVLATSMLELANA